MDLRFLFCYDPTFNPTFLKDNLMKKIYLLLNALSLIAIAFSFSSCRRNTNEVWEDTKTAGRHMNRGVRSLAGKHGDSRAVRSREEFYPYQEQYVSDSGRDFEVFPDYQNSDEIAMGDFIAPQPRETPGDPGSTIPGIEAFQDPSMNPEYARVFKPVHFEYNSSLVKEQQDLTTLSNVASYLRSHPNVYVFVEGHCDERGPEAYNLSLGARRSNSIRNMLINDGVDPDHVFTISYGKERPLVYEHHEEAWSQNRRGEFKIYTR